MGKGINMNAMDKLISGLSGNEENLKSATTRLT